MMELTLMRDPEQPFETPGRMAVNGVFCCFTLEPSLGDYGPDEAIPPGRYPVHIRWSPKFQEPIAHVDAVPGRSAIEIHDGNTAADTRGCILVGQERLTDGIAQSNAARLVLQAHIAQAQAANESVTLTVEAAALPA